ncbi:cold-inducible protein YdjO-related protein [Paenibacillus validus]|uniref:cold-inducible protein YdjO-related protein n=1 Tax=Paenibacillus TaxID=44249 RepID=UPI001F2667D3|nr:MULTISPECIES: cold-inducible protein YdjO-related protein [Paenibacillus]MED4601600.1 cold-inducible protein YdjO-related protein [Paenibacillus validus]MED4607614.1 cold-inducible protein YdjO-related protein [Paenibacillus validus]
METPTLAEQKQELRIWKCEDTNCNAWVREEFVHEESPGCPLCKSPMVQSYKLVPLAVKKVNKTFFMGKRRS